MANNGRSQRERVRCERRILIANVAIQPRAVVDLFGDVEIAAGIDDRIEPALIRLGEGYGRNDEKKKDERKLNPPSSLHQRRSSHTIADKQSAKSPTA